MLPFEELETKTAKISVHVKVVKIVEISAEVQIVQLNVR